MIEKLFKELENIKKENKELKDCIGKLNKRMKKIEDKEIEENNKNKIKEIEKRIEKLVGFHYIKKMDQLHHFLVIKQ